MSKEGKNVCFDTFGCRLNRAEALDEEAKYVANGWKVVPYHAEADVIVVRGCSVTQRAQRDTERMIEHIRARYPQARLVIQGCVRDPREKEKKAERPSSAPRKTSASPEPSGPRLPAENPTGSVCTRTARAYLKVQDGCGGRCTFCIVPKFRGAARSEPFDAVLTKARRFIDAGYHEIVVTGCNLSLYSDSGRRLCDLIAALAELDPTGCRIRIGSLEPGEGDLETVAAMAEHENVCRFLHLPVQSGAERILRLMHRPYTARHVGELVAEARRRMPLVAVGCDLMTGFPGESEIEFVATAGLLRRLEFSNAHIFPYSEREGTMAVGLPNAVPVALRRARAHELAKLVKKLRERYVHKLLGRRLKMVVEDAETGAGWVGEYVWVKPEFSLTHRKPVRRQLVEVQISAVHGDHLRGVVV